MPLSSSYQAAADAELTPLPHEHAVHVTRGHASRCAASAAAALQRFAGRDRALDACTLDPGWLTVSTRTRSVAVSPRLISHPGECHGHGLNAKCGPPGTDAQAHDIANSFVVSVSLSAAKRTSAVGAVSPDVNSSHRRYDSEVALTSIQDTGVAPLWGNLARDPRILVRQHSRDVLPPVRVPGRENPTAKPRRGAARTGAAHARGRRGAAITRCASACAWHAG